MIVVDAAGATEAVTGRVREGCCRATLDQEGVLRRVAGDLADVVDAVRGAGAQIAQFPL
jgi:hypothetical protein